MEEPCHLVQPRRRWAGCGNFGCCCVIPLTNKNVQRFVRRVAYATELIGHTRRAHCVCVDAMPGAGVRKVPDEGDGSFVS